MLEVAALTGWDPDDLAVLAAGDRIGWNLPALREAMGLLTRTGLPVVALAELSRWDVGPDQADLAREAALSAAAEPGQLRERAIELRDRLRNAQREALVAYLVADPTWPEVTSPDDLYAHFLIDVEMDACMTTSRLRQALSSVQLFVHRLLMGLEAGASLEPVDARQWEWMKAYRLWEANRRVFLHPENWIEPELRRDKSPFFGELEADLAQGELTSERAEQAVARYLAKLEQVADLQVAGLTRELESRPLPFVPSLWWWRIAGSTPVRLDVADDPTAATHVFAHTRGKPRRWYHRRWVNQSRWTAWEELSGAVDADSPHVLPVFFEGRLHLVWTAFESKPVKPPVPADQNAPPSEPDEYLEVRLTSMFYDNGTWSEPRLADGVAKLFGPPPVGLVEAATGWAGSTTPEPDEFELLVVMDGDRLRADLVQRGLWGSLRFRWPGFEMASGRLSFESVGGHSIHSADAPALDHVGSALVSQGRASLAAQPRGLSQPVHLVVLPHREGGAP